MSIKNNTYDSFFNKYSMILVCLFLVTATFAVYWQVQNYNFVNFDDGEYVYDNRYVQSGVILESIGWAFTTVHMGNWNPLTWLAHMLDSQLYGMNPGWHHLTNLLFHIANAVLLFFVFRKMTGSLWRSAFVAALFALHPLHVESVAWISERKDVLSTFFWMLTMLSYIWYAEHTTFNRFLLVVLFFTLGLMSKPMLVTLPFVLLLIDYWPLNRLQIYEPSVGNNVQQKSVILFLILEKLPLFILVAISSVVTFYAQKKAGAVALMAVIPLKARIANALVSYAKYIGKMVYPSKLALFYPLSGVLPIWQITGACLLFVTIFFLAIRNVKQRPYFAVGWLWYIGTLVPVIGLIQVGNQSMADRYTYVPLIGIFTIIAWGAPELVSQWRHRRKILVTIAVVLLLVLMAVTWKQVRYWENSIAIFEHTLKVTSDNYLAHNNLGLALDELGRTEEAIENYLQALQIKPDFVDAHNNIGNAMQKQGNTETAIGHYLHALRVKPNFEKTHNNLGFALASRGHTEKAIEHYIQALLLKPDYADAHNNLGNALAHQGRIEEAIKHYEQALRIKPDHEKAHNNLGIILNSLGRTEEAIKHYQQALRIKPDYEKAHNNLGFVLARQGRIEEAIKHYEQALRINPNFVDVHNHLGNALANLGRTQEAISHYLRALQINPDLEGLHNNLGSALVHQGRTEEAIQHYLQAIRIKPDFEEAHNNLGIAFFQKGNIEGAIAHFREALRIKPDHIHAKDNLKKVLMMRKQNR